MKQEMYVRKLIHFLLFLIGGKRCHFSSANHRTGQKKSGQQISLHPDAVDAEKRNMRRNEVYHEIKSKEEM